MRESDDAAAPIIVMMGVSGSGKTTVGRAVAAHLGWVYCEGDDFHPPSNVQKMRAGEALDDRERAPWLAAIAHWIDAQAPRPAVLACSALKRRYRDRLRANRPQVWFLHLRVAHDELERRVETRHHAYMPASLLDSQLDALEEPQADEPRTLGIAAGNTLAATTQTALRALCAHGIIEETK